MQPFVVVFGYPDVPPVIADSAQVTETRFIAVYGRELVRIAGKQVDAIGKDVDPPEIFAVPCKALATDVWRRGFPDDREVFVQPI
jgi:hypothetical protein